MEGFNKVKIENIAFLKRYVSSYYASGKAPYEKILKDRFVFIGNHCCIILLIILKTCISITQDELEDRPSKAHK